MIARSLRRLPSTPRDMRECVRNGASRLDAPRAPDLAHMQRSGDPGVAPREGEADRRSADGPKKNCAQG